MQNHWFVILPPILVVLLAFVTRRVIFSLIMGILSAALIAYDFNIFQAVPAIGLRITKILELDKLTSWETFWTCANIFLCLFLLVLTIIIVLIQESGGGYAYGASITKRLKTTKKAEASSLLMSLIFFFDDYFSILTVGSVMQPITDQFKVPRIKLGLLVNSIAGSLVIMFPLTSWMAEIVGQFRNSGIAAVVSNNTIVATSPFFVYINMIPFMFYSFIVIASLWYLVLSRVSSGIIASHEEIAQKTGNVFGGKVPVVRKMTEVSEEKKQTSSLADFLFSIIILFAAIGTEILYFGGYYLFGGQNDFITALEKANVFAALFMGSLIALIVSFVFFILRKRITLAQIPHIIREGFWLMAPTILILILIWMFSSLLKDDLATGQYLADKLIGYIDLSYLPVMFFIVAVCISVMTGSAWGTIGMLVPLGIPMLLSFMHIAPPATLDAVPMLLPLLAAIISGSLVGNHMSPIADVMLMSATSTGAYHLDLVKAQMSFTIPAIISSAFAYFLTGRYLSELGITKTVMLSLVAGILLNFIILYVLHVLHKIRVRKN